MKSNLKTDKCIRRYYYPVSKKKQDTIRSHNFNKWPIFKIISPLDWAAICEMNWSLKIPTHLKRVATLPCETLVFKNWSNLQVKLQTVRRELKNRIIGILRHLKWFGYICCDITLSFFIDSAGRDLFPKLCLPCHSVHHSLLAVQ